MNPIECCGEDMSHVDGVSVGPIRLSLFRCLDCEEWRWLACDLCSIDPFAITPVELDEIPNAESLMQEVAERVLTFDARRSLLD